jgi:hypothetical protein
MNMKGRIIINTSDLTSGIYFVNIVNDTSREIIPVVLTR